jgi:hypothetical protein
MLSYNARLEIFTCHRERHHYKLPCYKTSTHTRTHMKSAPHDLVMILGNIVKF